MSEKQKKLVIKAEITIIHDDPEHLTTLQLITLEQLITKGALEAMTSATGFMRGWFKAKTLVHQYTQEIEEGKEFE